MPDITSAGYKTLPASVMSGLARYPRPERPCR